MVRIRLRRIGAKKKPSYRIIVIDGRAQRDGAYIEMIGNYDPMTEPPTIRIDQEKANKWLQRGAQPSDRVATLLDKAGITSSASK